MAWHHPWPCERRLNSTQILYSGLGTGDGTALLYSSTAPRKLEGFDGSVHVRGRVIDAHTRREARVPSCRASAMIDSGPRHRRDYCRHHCDATAPADVGGSVQCQGQAVTNRS